MAIRPAGENHPPRVVFCNANGGALYEKVPTLLYWGSTDGFRPDRHWRVPVNSGYEASSADLNADGYVDLIAINSGHVGEISRTDPHLGANIFWGGPLKTSEESNGVKLPADHVSHGFDPTRRTVLREFSLGASKVADLNRDGYLDIVLGAFQHNDGEPEVLVVYYGMIEGFRRERRVAIPCPVQSTGAIVADYNGDDW